MTKAKATKATTKAEPREAGAKAYRHTRTGAIRRSTSPLGYPYVEADAKAEEEAPE
jgi:hypothetical protein